MIEAEYPKIDVTDRLELIDTKRGGISYILDGSKFVKCADSRYRCTLYNQKCKCRILIDDGRAFLINNHNHD